MAVDNGRPLARRIGDRRSKKLESILPHLYPAVRGFQKDFRTASVDRDAKATAFILVGSELVFDLVSRAACLGLYVRLHVGRQIQSHVAGERFQRARALELREAC